jgi:hypothetical protein
MAKKQTNIDEVPTASPLAEGMMTDFITGQAVKETEKGKGA